jgi:hypothetical protein
LGDVGRALVTKDDFLGHYWSNPMSWGGQTIYVRGHSPWVQFLFHPDPLVHEHAQFMLDLDVKHEHRRWHWWSLRVPPPLFTMVWLDCPHTNIFDRVVGRLAAMFVLWRSM